MANPKTVRCPVCGADPWMSCISRNIYGETLIVPLHVTRRLVADGKCDEPAPNCDEEEPDA